MILIRLLLLCLLTVIVVPCAHALEERSGRTDGGSFYRIAVPEGWTPQQGLVLFHRGFRATPPGPNPGLGPLVERQLSQGYAVAASSYSLNGWSLFNTVNDTRELLDVFHAEFGEPEEIFVYGGSLGGLVSLQLAEQTDLGNIVGAYALCPPAAGSRVWDSALDLRLIYDSVCGDDEPRRLPGGPGPYSFMLDTSDISFNILSVSGIRIALSLASCVGYETPSFLVSSGMQQRLARILSLTSLSEDFFEINMAYALGGLSDLFRDSDKLDEALAFDNRYVDYGDPQINADIERVASQPFDRLTLKRNWTPSGRVGDVRVLSTTTDKDDLVVVEHQHELARLLPADRLAQGIIVEDQGSHCGYREAEVIAGWELLREWVAGAPQPDAASMQQRCQDLAASGEADGPCRYAPSYQVQALDSRIRPRNLPGIEPDARFTGLWHDPSRSGEGWVIERLPNDDALVYWFTYPTADDPGAQEWVIAQGPIVDNAILLDDSFTARGAVFGEGFDPDAVTLRPWGQIEMLFEECGVGQLRYRGADGYGTAIRELRQLTYIGDQRCSTSTAPAISEAGPTQYSGSWYNPERDGEGIVLHWQDDGRAFALWFSYDLDANALWLFAEGSWDGERLNFTDAVLRPIGSGFGADFDASSIERPLFGSMSLQFSDCERARLQYQALDPAFGSGEIELHRLSIPAGLPGCGS